MLVGAPWLYMSIFVRISLLTLEELAVQMDKGKVGGRRCSCDEDIEGAKLDGRECVVGPRMVDGGENATLLPSGGGMMKKDGATGPNSQQYILQAFESWGYGGFFTIWHQVTVRISRTRGCSRLVGAATAPRGMEGVVEMGEVLGDCDEHWKVLRSSSVHTHCSEKMIRRLDTGRS
jgi:hypothetical protein